MTLTPVVEVPAPIAVTPLVGTEDLLVAGQTGQVHRIVRSRSSEGVRPELVQDPVLDLGPDISEVIDELGLLDIVVAPDGESFYASFTDTAGTSTVWQYPVVDGEIDVSVHWTVIQVEQRSTLHHAGDLAFGPDGYLYFSLGDGGSDLEGPDAGPEFAESLRDSQDPQTLIGSILRIDPVVHGPGYRVPEDNPFADGVDGRPEVWLYGVRNPWRSAFDPESTDFWVTDVGFSSREEINLFVGPDAGRAANLGWGRMEGSLPFQDSPGAPPGAVPPTFEYSHDDGRCAIVGGAVYRGSLLPALDGAFVFSDYCDPVLRSLVPVDGGWEERSLGVEVPEGQLTSIEAGPGGELYVTDRRGTVYRLDPTTEGH